jgi:nicotinamide riboside transporter PnuC
MEKKTNWIKRLFGDTHAQKEHVLVVVAMLIVTALYEYAAVQIIPDFSVNWYEFVGTWAGLVCVWLTRTQNVLCWPWGIVSSISFGFFFAQIGLPGQQWLNWGYFLVIQMLAWPYWVFGGKGRTTLQISRLSNRGRMITFLCVVFGTFILYRLMLWL